MYKLKINTAYGQQVKVIIRENADGSITSFGEYEGNTDYQEYLKWLEAGNAPLGADTPLPSEEN